MIIYSGDDLRTLAGRKFAKKRNHIHQFESEYGGRWEYRRLDYEDRGAVLAFLRDWEKNKTAESGYVNLGRSFDATDTLAIEIQGVEKILSSRALLKKLRVGGIFIDGKLFAFSVGGYNPKGKTAVIEIEKADPEITGLYQVINREFLCHEFPEAEFVNREDDVAIPGLRQAKMSYHPILLEKRYSIIPKDSADI